MGKKIRKSELEILSQHLEGLTDYTKSLWQFLPLALSYLSSKGFILDVNRAFEDFSLWTISEISGKHLSSVLAEKEASEIIDQTLKKRGLSNRETDLLTKKSEKVAVAVYSRAREDRKGNIIGFFLAFVDIRESKKFREELKRQVSERTKELQKKMEELEKFRKVAVGRELKMIELKKEIERLKKELKNKGQL
ncbi:PAS domain S-box protein [Patescibacteria group bacterium]|nr:PAS domain S-box protein [Patescibacteria group bacterium]